MAPASTAGLPHLCAKIGMKEAGEHYDQIREQLASSWMRAGVMEEVGQDFVDKEAAALAVLEALREATGGDAVEIGCDGSVEDAEGYLERWILERISLLDLAGLSHVSTQRERFPLQSLNRPTRMG